MASFGNKTENGFWATSIEQVRDKLIDQLNYDSNLQKRTQDIRDLFKEIQQSTAAVEKKLAAAMRSQNQAEIRKAKAEKAALMKSGKYNMALAAQNIDQLEPIAIWRQWIIYRGGELPPQDPQIAQDYARLFVAEKAAEMKEKLAVAQKLWEDDRFVNLMQKRNRLIERENKLINDWRWRQPVGAANTALRDEVERVYRQIEDIDRQLSEQYDPELKYLANAHLKGVDLANLREQDLWMAWLVYHTRNLDNSGQGHSFVCSYSDYGYIEDDKDPRFVKYRRQCEGRAQDERLDACQDAQCNLCGMLANELVRRQHRTRLMRQEAKRRAELIKVVQSNYH
ncbi:hypothetical protein D6821_01835 [Candidatus Parcubacteria bacterium]|nr:MAG: hypothetical protein D6821_01835 [Candidatus Parcubacteria bacterium]